MSQEVVTREAGNNIAQPVTVPASGNTRLADLDVAAFEQLTIQIVVATQALDGFRVSVRPKGGVAYTLMYSASGDYTSPAGLVVDASGDLTALAAGSSGILVLDVSGLDSVRLEASAALDSASVTVIASGR